MFFENGTICFAVCITWMVKSWMNFACRNVVLLLMFIVTGKTGLPKGRN